jgi:SAM-dependent methyltransferase
MEIDNQNYLRNPLRMRFNMNHFLRQQISSLPQNASVLDIGCGDGHILKQICSLRPDLKLEGIDIREIPAEAMDARIAFTRCGIEEFQPRCSFECVLAIAVLEHLPRPEMLMMQAHRFLRPGGRLYLNAPSVSQLLLFGDQNFYSDYTHIRPFNARGLKRLCLDFGFEVVALDTQATTGFKCVPRLVYRLCRGVLTGDLAYINSAILYIGGGCVEIVGRRV